MAARKSNKEVAKDSPCEGRAGVEMRRGGLRNEHVTLEIFLPDCPRVDGWAACVGCLSRLRAPLACVPLR